MTSPYPKLAFVGFGEAATAFAQGLTGPLSAYDRKTDNDATRRAKLDDFARAGVAAAATNKEAVADAPLILSLVTAGSARAAAVETARAIGEGALYCDMNSVASETKRAAAEAIVAAGGRYADVAVMAPAYPLRRAVPLLIAGPDAADVVRALSEAGFTDVRAVGGRIGDAAAIKMIRSVIVKGVEALTAECMLAADRAGVLGEVIASLDASWPGADWAKRADYNLDRMMAHGIRRAEEMTEVVATLDALGTGSAMARATAQRQRAIGRLGLDPRATLDDKLAALRGERQDEAA